MFSNLYPASLALGKHFAGHEQVHLGNKEYARGEVHINTPELFNVVLERAKQGVFHPLSRRHLPRYLNEVAFRWNNRDPLEVKQNGLSKIVMKPKPILEKLESHLDHAIATQLRRTIRGCVATPQPLFG